MRKLLNLINIILLITLGYWAGWVIIPIGIVLFIVGVIGTYIHKNRISYYYED